MDNVGRWSPEASTPGMTTRVSRLDDALSDSYESFIRRYRNRNFVCNVFVLSFYNLGLSFVFPATIMTVYASRLTDSAALIGTIPALFTVGMSLPQLLYANVAERLTLKRPLTLRLAVMSGFPNCSSGCRSC